MTLTAPAKTALLYAPLDTFALGTGPTASALDLCEGSGFGLTAMLLNQDSVSPASGRGLTQSELMAQADARDHRNHDNEAALESACAGRGIDLQTITAIDHSRGYTPYICDHARLHDLVISGASPAGLLSEKLVCESILFNSGRPLLLVPHGAAGGRPIRRIAVAWDNSRAAARALGDAVALFPGLSSAVLLTVGDEKQIAGSIDEGELVARLGHRLPRLSFEQVSLGKRRIGGALQHHAMESGADLLVMGAHAHSALREMVLGGATIDVLNDPAMRILLAH